MEEDASVFTSDTTTPSLKVYKIQTTFQKEYQKLYCQWEFIYKVNINTEMSLAILTDNNNGDALTFKDKYTALLQQELQNPYWCLCHDLKEDLMGTKFFIIFVKYVVYDWG